MKVFLAGATGALGTTLVPKLVAGGRDGWRQGFATEALHPARSAEPSASGLG